MLIDMISEKSTLNLNQTLHISYEISKRGYFLRACIHASLEDYKY